MSSGIEKLFGRILFIPITGIFVFLLFTQFGTSLNNIIYGLTEDNYLIFLRFDTIDKVIFWISCAWIIGHFILEITAFYSKNFGFTRLLTNLRYAPIAIYMLSFLIVPIYDVGMIEYSKAQIRNYVYDSSQTIEEPDFRLYNNYRHWCGNGASSWENYLYFDTASEGIYDENPYVRSRSLLMAADVQDWINGGDARFRDYLAKSCRDSDPIVQGAAEKYLNNRNSNCQKYLLSK